MDPNLDGLTSKHLMQDGNFSVDQNLKCYDFLEKTVFPKHVRFTGLPVSYSFYSLKKSAVVYVDSFRHPGLF